MGWTVTALVLTVLMGGIIAYNGDLIGRKFGKKRLTLFGMRPKHTAILITSVTGVMISALTTIALFMVAPPVREVILKGEQALRMNEALRRESREERVKSQLSKDAAAKADDERRLAETRLKDVQSRLEPMQKQLVRAEKELVRSQDTLANTRQLVRDATRRYAALKSMNQSLLAGNARLAKQNELLRGKNRALAQLNQDLTTLSGKLKDENQDLATKNEVARIRNEQLFKQNDELVAENTRLTREGSKLRQEYASLIQVSRANINWFADEVLLLETQLSFLMEDNAKLLADNRKILARLDSVDKVSVELARSFEDLRLKRLVFRSGEDLARIVIPAGASPKTVRESLGALLHSAHTAAFSRGAGKDSAGMAVRVFERDYLNERNVTIPANQEDRLIALVNRISRSTEPVCVLAMAVANSAEGEPAIIDFQPYADRLVYRRKQQVSSRRIDATMPAEKVYAELVEFFKRTSRIAVERGMIPTLDPSLGQFLSGMPTQDELINLADRVKSQNRVVKVYAIAMQDTNSSDPLKFDFKIEPSL